MTNESPSAVSRFRAAIASVLASFAAGARRLEHWSARGMRPMLIAVIAAAILVAGLVAVVSPVRHAAGWFRGGPEIGRAHRGPEPKPIGKPHGEPAGKPEGRAVGKPEGKPELPAPPAPPAPAGVPAAPVPAGR